jgi:ribosome-associated translation inhibitor RaiA
MNKDRIQQWTYYLDKNMQDFIFVKITLSEDFEKMTEYVVIYLTIIEMKPIEVVKYDASENETSHVHINYLATTEKLFQNKQINYETVDEILDYIENTWRKLKSKYQENH